MTTNIISKSNAPVTPATIGSGIPPSDSLFAFRGAVKLGKKIIWCNSRQEWDGVDENENMGYWYDNKMAFGHLYSNFSSTDQIYRKLYIKGPKCGIIVKYCKDQ